MFEKDKIAICIPSKNGFKRYFDNHFYAWINQLNEQGQKYKIFYLRDDTNHVATQRNRVAEMVLKDGTCGWMLWLDDDLLFPTDVIEQFKATGKNFVTGIYWNRTDKGKIPYPLVRKEGHGAVDYEYYKYEDKPLFKINASGFGCFWMKTELLYYICKPWFELSEARGLGEDIMFCNDLESVNKVYDGFQLYALATVFCKHLNYDQDTGDMYAIPDDKLYEEVYEKYCKDKPVSITF